MIKNKRLLLVVIFLIVAFTVTLALYRPLLHAEGIERGKALYNAYCIHCHGLSGGGDGPAAGGLNPKPTNFRDTNIMSSITPEMMEKTIVEGVEGTSMRGWSTILKPEEVKDIIEYIKSFMKE